MSRRRGKSAFLRACRAALPAVLLLLLFLGGCGNVGKGTSAGERQDVEGLQIVTTISILADLIQNVAGGYGTVEYLVPVGDNPEDYELLPGDFQRVSEADIFFLNGWGLEEMMERSLANVTGIEKVYLTEGIAPLPLAGKAAAANDPHAWLDPMKASIYVENILAALVEKDPAREQQYRRNAGRYTAELQELHLRIKEKVARVPEHNAVIITSENAFKYFGEAYGFRTEGIWEINAHEEGTPQQIARIVNLVRENGIPALFLESSVDGRYMETISMETGVPIAGIVYTDSLGPGDGTDTYTGMIRHNVETFVAGLGR